MTDHTAALSALVDAEGPQRDAALEEFAAKWKDDALVMLKWLQISAGSNVPGNLANVDALMKHPSFVITTPNCCYALLGGFAASPVNFHAVDGSGYKWLADRVIQLDKITAQVAARMVAPFTRWKKYDTARQALMKAELERIASVEGLSENVYEIVSKSLE